MPSAISNLKAKINDLKTRVAQNSISPNFVGGILDEIVDTSTAAAEAAAAQSTADRALAAATVNSDRLDLYADDINNLQNDVSSNATDIRVNTEALTVLNRRGQVESFAAVLTSDPDDDPIPEELAGKRVWSTQFNKFLEINIGGDPPYREPEDSAAVVDKFYVCDGRLYLGVKVSQTATTLKPLFDSEIEQLSRTHSITLTRVADLRYSWSGAALGDIRQGDILTWTDADEMFRAVVFGERTSGTRREVCAMFTRDGDEAIEFSLLWLHENGEAYETVFDSSQTLAGQFAACQNKLTDTADIQVRAEARPSGQHYTPYGLYLKDSAKRAVFNDMFNLAAGSDGGYKPSEAPDPAKPYLLNTLWLSYEEAEREMLDYTSIITFWKRAIRRSGPNVFCIGSFDETTRTGTLNGISGLSLSEMTDILLAGNPTAAGATYHFAFNPLIRTNLWQMWYMGGTVVGQRCFYKCANIEVACASYLRVDTDTFSHCPKLHTIIGPLYGSGNNPAPFRGCSALVNLPGFGWNGNLDISDSPLLSLASVSDILAKGKEGATITVHTDVFAKLTGDTTNEGAAALTDDEKAAWAAVLEAACAKNISFATA